MKLDKYNEQLEPCFSCKTKQAVIERNENAVGVMCDCGIFFAFENPKTPLKEVVEWWNNHYGMDKEQIKSVIE
jgi:hypothetical protein